MSKRGPYFFLVLGCGERGPKETKRPKFVMEIRDLNNKTPNVIGCTDAYIHTFMYVHMYMYAHTLSLTHTRAHTHTHTTHTHCLSHTRAHTHTLTKERPI